MKIGTKSLLFGGHQFLIHPMFVTVAWTRLYHKPPNPRELLCIVIHDWGYWGKPNMDGNEGELHPLWGAKIAQNLFGSIYWYDFVAYHSRFLARRDGVPVSKLCLADKLGVAMMPTWLWVFLTSVTREVQEYMNQEKYEIFELGRKSASSFFQDYRVMVKKWVETRNLDVGGTR